MLIAVSGGTRGREFRTTEHLYYYDIHAYIPPGVHFPQKCRTHPATARAVLCLEGSVVLASTLGELALERHKRLYPSSCEHRMQYQRLVTSF